MPYKWCRFRCARPIIKGTLLGQQSAFSPVPRLPLERFSWKFIPRNRSAYPTNDARFL
jgi:hypothetical protein